MERTIGHRWNAPLVGAIVCDDCGARYPRSELQRNADGFLLCQSCNEGRCRTELDDARVEASQDIDERQLIAEQAMFENGRFDAGVD